MYFIRQPDNGMFSMRYRSAQFLIVNLYFCCSAQVFGPSFSLSLCGTYGNRGDREYSYLLNQTGDSAVLYVQGHELLLGRAAFAGVKKTIVKHVVNLTEESYGSPKDSADFNGALMITALDRTTIVRLNARLVAGTLPLQDTSMTGLLRLMMKQVDDSLRLPQFNGNPSDKKPVVSVKKKRL
jgi:hypothetical protein